MPTVHVARDAPGHIVAARARADQWRRVARGLYVPTTAPTGARSDALARIVGIHRKLDGVHCFSHASAALIHDLPLWQIEPVTHLYQPSSPSSSRQRDIERHVPWPDPSDVVDRSGLPVTSLERTAWDCAVRLRPLAALVVVDAALHAGLDPETLRARAGASAGRRGVARGRSIIEFADAGAESAYESACRFLLLREGFPVPQTQIPIETRLGTFWADLGWAQWRVIIEYDGRTKYAGPDDLIREKRRHDAIVEAGWRVVRVTKADISERFSLAHRVTPYLPSAVVANLRPRRELVW